LTNQAVGDFTKALDLNPLLWAAYEQLCLLGLDSYPGGFFSWGVFRLTFFLFISCVRSGH